MKLILPLEIYLPRKTREDKKIVMNLNIYRNLHTMVMDGAKKEMKRHVELALDQAEGQEIGKAPYRFTYTIFPTTGRAFDLGNVCAAVQKFADDALTELGLIKDDNYKIVREINYRFGSIDKENPRAELTIEGI